ncbi:hypothetical protein HK096_004779, partial [Nowakowskiella sp. JEL0078]
MSFVKHGLGAAIAFVKSKPNDLSVETWIESVCNSIGRPEFLSVPSRNWFTILIASLENIIKNHDNNEKDRMKDFWHSVYELKKAKFGEFNVKYENVKTKYLSTKAAQQLGEGGLEYNAILDQLDSLNKRQKTAALLKFSSYVPVSHTSGKFGRSSSYDDEIFAGNELFGDGTFGRIRFKDEISSVGTKRSAFSALEDASLNLDKEQKSPEWEPHHSESLFRKVSSPLPDQNPIQIRSEENEFEVDVPVHIPTLIQDDTFNPASNWKIKADSKFNGINVSKALKIGAGNMLSVKRYEEMKGDERYAVATTLNNYFRLSHSGIIDPSCEFQLLKILDLKKESDRKAFQTESVEHFQIIIPPKEFTDEEEAFMAEIHQMCRSGSFLDAQIVVREEVTKLLKMRTDIKVGTPKYDFKIALDIYESILTLFQLDPKFFNRPPGEKPPSENDFVAFFSMVFLKLFQGTDIAIRTGELMAEGNEKDERRKVDLIAMRGNYQLSHSEFARYCPQKKAGTEKFWHDRSKIARLNQRIFNNLRKYGSTPNIAIQQSGKTNLIGLHHVDHGVYVIDTKHVFNFPINRDGIDESTLEFIKALLYFKDIVLKKSSRAVKSTVEDGLEFQQINPAFTKKK